MISRTLTLLAGLCGLFFMPLAPAAEPPRLVELVDLRADAAQAGQRQLPMLVMFSASYCGYCSIVKEEFLQPMLISGDYTDKVMIRVIEIDSGNQVRDLDGKLVDPERLAERYNIQLTPTVAFIDGNGKEIAQRVVGLTTVDFYGGYLDEAIDHSLAQLRGDHRFTGTNAAASPSATRLQ